MSANLVSPFSALLRGLSKKFAIFKDHKKLKNFERILKKLYVCGTDSVQHFWNFRKILKFWQFLRFQMTILVKWKKL